LQFFRCLLDCHFELICHSYTYPVAFFNLVHLHWKLVLDKVRSHLLLQRRGDASALIVAEKGRCDRRLSPCEMPCDNI
ncbi:hypothetical protein, partial [Coleofasciculus sp. FACHB-SPT36]|uniref:hypothetical protein n=1 Tax=Coleofasciculus sp. FACHB-SPT36 TaxID=2692790 RepID=UPI001A7E92CB